MDGWDGVKWGGLVGYVHGVGTGGFSVGLAWSSWAEWSKFER